MNLTGRIALVTGGARGIGRGCALELARSGADVIVNDLRPEDAERTAGEIRAFGRRSAIAAGDVFTRSGCEQVAGDALKAFDRLDILVSNPAFSKRSPFLEFDPTLFERIIQGTLTGGFHMSQLVARHMAERGGGGKIVFISSVHAAVPYARASAYNAAKLGLEGLAMTIANELTEHRINVNVIEPGWIDTPYERETFGDEAVDKGGESLPWGRLGKPEDIGRAAVFLCSPEADYITGAVLKVDGGFVFRGAR